MSSNVNLKIQDLNFSYTNDDNFALRDINIDFEKSKTYAILGPNGSGKSTLLFCINNFINNYEGQISINHNGQLTNIDSLNYKTRAKIISHVTQHNHQNSLSVYDTVMLGRRPYINISPNITDHEIVSKAIDSFNLNHLSLKATNELSGGEAQSVHIARAFAQTTPIILLDEPSNNLDVKKQHEVFKIIDSEKKKKGLTVIYVLHDINHAIKYADELIFMKDGSIAYQGNKDIVDEKLLHKIYDVDSHIFIEDKEKFIVI